MTHKSKLAAPGLAVTLICSITLAACSQDSSAPKSAPDAVAIPQARTAAAGLSEEYAKLRKQQVAQVDYQLSVNLDRESDRFSGTVTADTTFQHILQQPLTIDFAGGTVESVAVDGQNIPVEYNGHFITIAAQFIPNLQHAITVHFQHPFSKNGSGLHRFEDPKDGKVYTYTDFEPYDANRLFPHFDQPNLKARYTLDVTAPKDWIVISAERENRIEKKGELRHWFFPQSQKFSSYVFSLHAGPYHIWEDEADGIPLRLMARQSLAQYVKPEDWFTFTKQSFAFFQPYFDIDYPFKKYDQILVPDFNAGAMENVGSVTFNDSYVSRGEKTQAQRMRLANVIAHEMAHQWFGDLVTMNWWDDLWLNESFATYMANLSLAENSEFTNVWENFYLGTKQWAYNADQRPTTHAIQLPVQNTDEAFANFDGITYGKGGSILKQLPYYLGKEAFRKGVSNYLKELSYRNSTLDDFMGHLGAAAGMDLEQWQQQWLYKAGLNTIETSFQCQKGQITELTLTQTAPTEYPILRTQRTQLGFYRMNGDSMKRVATLPVLYSGAITKVKEAVGLPCPEILYPNEGDWAFVKINLDPVSVENMSKHINQIEPPFVRLMLWQSLFDSTYDAKLPLDKYISFLLSNGAAEEDINAVRLNARNLGFVYSYLSQIPIESARRDALQLSIEKFIWEQLQQSPAGSDRQKTWFRAFTGTAHSPRALSNARQMLLGELAVDGLKLDPDMRWDLITLQNRYLFSDYEQAVERELQTDNSDRAKLNAIAAEAVRPLPQSKQKWLDNLSMHRDKYKLSELREAAYSMFPSEQIGPFNNNSARIFEVLEQINAEDSPELLSTYASIFPLICNKAGAQKLKDTLEENQQLKPTLVKALKNHLYSSRRCMAMGEVLAQNRTPVAK
ncbi:aminopeptidase N [Microbulbifer sp. 2205BS26-8]|uniref:aminopeptidase N n=1 Tax=Microbulbifer sp. 2205BS26-8 TaxID=3064386 RepID=UPI00273F0A2A|nr:aminopeptidase N [Microbulbifer sp. 2205BS26-8]MDP5208194.1 aminopeptidase N [Microbulbifer sp. 2205BS26-8]